MDQTPKQKQKSDEPYNSLLVHVPVLLNEVLHFLAPVKGESYLDVTAGYGGHAAAILKRTACPEKATLIDRDETAVHALRQRFEGQDVQIKQSDFASTTKQLVASGQSFDLILADLGVSSLHLNQPERGFSFQAEGPLDMRMDSQQEKTAASIVNHATEEELEDILRYYGEEPKARQIARLIIRNRPIQTTTQLAKLVASVWPGRSRVHPATRTFQALRIAVNDELMQLEQSIPLWIAMLTPGGRLAVISFHSLEDRVVKQTLKDHSGNRFDAEITVLTRRPVVASPEEIVHNPRSRSAKLRAAVKIKTKERGVRNAYTGKKQLPNL